MSNGERFYNAVVRGLSGVFILVGALILFRTFSGGGGPASLGFVLGLIFLAVGGLRLWLVLRSGS